MLVIRLSRTGRRNQPKYRLVVAEHTAPIKGKVVEILGSYEPTSTDKKLVFDKEKIETYLKNGAKPSNTVAKILNKNGFDLPVDIRPERKPKKAVEEKAPEKPAQAAPEASTEETSGEEAPAESTEPVEENGVLEESAPAEEANEEAPATSVEEEKTEEPVSATDETMAEQEEAPTEEETKE